MQANLVPIAWVWTIYSVWIVISNTAATVVAAQLLRTRKRRENTPARITTLIILHLSVSDFATGFQGLVIMWHTRGDYNRLGTAGCDVATFFIFISLPQSIFMVLLLGFVRYRRLVQQSVSLRFVKIAIATCYVLNTALAAFCVGTGAAQVQPSGFYCAFEYGAQTALSAVLTMSIMIICFVPGLLLLVLYARAFWNIRQDEAVIGKNKHSPKVARLGVSVVAVYYVTILPLSFHLMQRMAIPSSEDPNAAITDAVIGLFVHMNVGVNPILYFAFQKDFRDMAAKYLPCISTFGTSSTKTNSSTTFESPKASAVTSSVEVHSLDHEVSVDRGPSTEDLEHHDRDFDEEKDAATNEERPTVA